MDGVLKSGNLNSAIIKMADFENEFSRSQEGHEEAWDFCQVNKQRERMAQYQ